MNFYETLSFYNNHFMNKRPSSMNETSALEGGDVKAEINQCNIESCSNSMLGKLKLASPSLLTVKNGLKYHFLHTKDVLYIKAAGSYSMIIMLNGDFFKSSKKLKVIAELLPDFFVRVHRSYLVNIYHVKEISENTGELKLINDVVVQITKKNKKTLIERARKTTA